MTVNIKCRLRKLSSKVTNRRTGYLLISRNTEIITKTRGKQCATFVIIISRKIHIRRIKLFCIFTTNEVHIILPQSTQRNFIERQISFHLSLDRKHHRHEPKTKFRLNTNRTIRRHQLCKNRSNAT